MSTTPPGWYPDNADPAILRYWDGQAWTAHTAPALPGQPAPGPTAYAGTSRGSSGFARGVVAGIVACFLVVVIALVATGSDDDAASVSVSDETRDARTGPPERVDELDSSRSPGRERTFVVVRVVDGDTVDLGNGERVRLAGIDTPEVGECGFERSSAALGRLVLGQQVRLTRVQDNRDSWGRLLRYVDISRADAGLRLIRLGLAVARYDSRDGYGAHPRESRYVAADRANPNVRCAPAAPASPQPLTGGGGGCAPGYTPCVAPYPPDVDCADVDGPIAVTGTDPHGLDADADGVACE